MLAVAGFLTLNACDGNGLPKPSCPPTPTKPDFGQPAAAATESTVDIELSGSYVKLRIRDLIETKVPSDPAQVPESGVKVHSIQLKESGTPPNRLNLISIEIEPWLKGSSGKPATLNRWYILTLRLIPHLINPQTIPDSNRRKQLLRCGQDPECGESGVVLAFDLHELYNKTFARKVECPSSDYDFIDDPVLRSVHETLFGDPAKNKPAQEPLVLPTQQITKMVAGIAGSPVNLTGVAIGTDGDLKIGLLMDQGSSIPFVAQAFLRPGEHWGVRIDTSLVSTSIRKTVIEKAAQQSSSIVIDNVAASFTEGEIVIDAAGHAPQGLCGVVNFSAKARARPRVCRKANGRSALQICEGPSTTSPDLGLWSGPCLLFRTIFTGGLAVANIATSTPQSCPELAELQFSAGANDDLYATKIDTNNIFFITGRSQLMDTRSGTTPPMPTCP
jgi:hypothetical protein